MSRNGVHVFGVRHLSPMAAWGLRATLDRVRPSIVLIEGLADANDLAGDITHRQTRPPIAILAYTDVVPVRTLVYPMASYSPEYQALVWADEHNVPAKFIDLPSSIFLALTARHVDGPERPDVDSEGNRSPSTMPASTYDCTYDQVARAAGERDYEAYWERRFEHQTAPEAYRRAAHEFGRQLRELRIDSPHENAETLIRESFMRRQIDAAIADGHSPDRIVAVVGAFHASVLGDDQDALTDEELAALPIVATKQTLMPYSYFKLSSQSGYGAGNHAPAYCELIWDCLRGGRGGVDDVAALYLTKVVRKLRRSGTHRSTAEVIESVRLSRTLSGLKGGRAPVLDDLRDAAVAVIGQGDRGLLADSMARVEVGTAVGTLPKGVSQTSIQDDFNRKMDELKLESYRGTVMKDLVLDLRENRRAKTETTAFLDLNRSTFLHRLALLEVPFASSQPRRQSGATWGEAWQLRWTPEAEIALVESVLLGETVELATAFKLKQSIDGAKTIQAAAALVATAARCELLLGLLAARGRLQELASQSSAVSETAAAAHELMQTIRFGNVRRLDTQPLLPLVDELYTQACIGLVAAADCDAAAAKNLITAIDSLNQIALQLDDRVDETLLAGQLRQLAERDDRNPVLSGYAAAVLLERGDMAADELAREVSRRLSPGIPADLGAGWFEGLAARNRYALLARQALWTQLAHYIEALDDEQFRRSLVFLRRGLGSFSAPEKRTIAENLGQYWGVHADAASELIAQTLTDEDSEELKSLNEFDFDDF